MKNNKKHDLKDSLEKNIDTYFIAYKQRFILYFTISTVM